MKLYDIGEITKRIMTDEGFLLVPAKIAKVGIQEYAREELEDELPSELDVGSVVRLLRPESEVFAEDSLATFRNRPVTNGHPPEFVNSRNYSKYQIGFSRDTIGRDGDKVTAELVVQDANSIEEIQAGKNQISVGYETDIKWNPGFDSNFGEYDGIQTNIRGNHIAILSNGRAGSGVRLDDQNKEIKKMTVKRTLNGITFELSDQGAEVFDAQSKKIEELDAKIAELKDGESSELKDARAEIEKLRGELDATKAQILTDEAIDERVKARTALVDRAKKLDPEVEVDGKSDLEIKTAIVNKVADGIETEGKSEEYISAVFDTLKAPEKSDGGESKKVADMLNPENEDGSLKVVDSKTARERFIERGRNAWKEKKTG
jgi:hypothetical protein